MEANKWENWGKIRAKGTWNFVFFRGILGWGIPFGIFFWIYQFFNSRDSIDREILFEIGYLFFFISVCLIGGFSWGILMCFFSETSYQRSRKNKDFNIWIPKQKDNLK